MTWLKNNRSPILESERLSLSKEQKNLAIELTKLTGNTSSSRWSLMAPKDADIKRIAVIKSRINQINNQLGI